MKQERTCLNCDAVLEKEFCSQCGQKSIEARIRVNEIVKEVLSNVFAFETPFLRTIVQLVIRPGKFCREFIEGQRKPFYKPIQFYIVCMAIYLLAFYTFLDLEQVTQENPVSDMMDSFGWGSAKGFDAGTAFMLEHMKFFQFLEPLFMALAGFLLFRSRKLYLGEWLSFTLFSMGLFQLLEAIAMPLIPNFPIVSLLVAIITYTYFLWAVWQFLPSKRFFEYVKSVLMIGLGSVFTVLAIFIIIFVIFYSHSILFS